MLNCTFALNNAPLSTLHCGAMKFPAFSGIGRHVNRRMSACLADAGPIPPGEYYIFDRQSGGLPGPLRDAINGRHTWFALYAIDEKIDDEMMCNEIRRGRFRLHPKGPLGVSTECIVIDSRMDFMRLRGMLKNAPQHDVPGTTLKAYGRVWVK